MTDFDPAFHHLPHDTPIVQLLCREAFDGLSPKEKLYALHISDASWQGAPICLFQTSPESPYLFHLILDAFAFTRESVENLDFIREKCSSEDAFNQAMVYIAQILAEFGNYKSFGDTKVVPQCSQEDLKNVLLTAADRSGGEECISRCIEIWAKISVAVYSLAPRIRCLGLGENGLSTYFSSNCSQSDADLSQNFLDKHLISAYNTRLFKEEDGSYTVRVASASKNEPRDFDFEGTTFHVETGDHMPMMKNIVTSLTAARDHVANETQAKMLDHYIQSFDGGSIDDHINGSREWIKDKGPAVESYIGFIESYQDPAGSRGEWEGFVAVVNVAQSKKFSKLVDNAADLLPLLPWPGTFEKDVFKRPDFTSLDVVAYGSSSIPAGINIPNYDCIRGVDGFKNVSLGNVLASAYKPKPEEPVTFLRDEDMELYKKYVTQSFDVQVGLHELLGHGSGKIFTDESVKEIQNPLTGEQVASWYGEGETYDSKFQALGSPLEECRAECVGMYLCTNHDVWTIFGHDELEGDDVSYVNWLDMVRKGVMALEYYTPEKKRWGQAHMHARFAIFSVLREAGQGFLTLEGDGQEVRTTVVLDRMKIGTVGREAIARFLVKIQVYKSTGDVAGAKAMFDSYTNVGEDMLRLREEVLHLRKPRKLFVQPHIRHVSNADGSEVELVEFDPTPLGIIQSFTSRYSVSDLSVLVPLADAEQKYHVYDYTEL